MKRMTALVTALLLFVLVNCKKGSDTPTPPPLVDVKGTWKLSKQTDQKTSGTTSYSATDFPCLLNNQLVISADSTFTVHYIGTEGCFVVKTATYSIEIGDPGETVRTGKWTENTDAVIFTTPTGSVTYSIVTTAGNTQLIASDYIAATQDTFTSIFIR